MTYLAHLSCVVVSAVSIGTVESFFRLGMLFSVLTDKETERIICTDNTGKMTKVCYYLLC